jgi:hypothetical protein
MVVLFGNNPAIPEEVVKLVAGAGRSFHDNLEIFIKRLGAFLGLLGKEIYASCPWRMELRHRFLLFLLLGYAPATRIQSGVRKFVEWYVRRNVHEGLFHPQCRRSLPGPCADPK